MNEYGSFQVPRNKLLKKIIFVLSGLWIWVGPARGASLKDACLESMNNSKILRSSKEYILSAQSRLKSISAQLWPSLSVTSDVGLARSQPKLDESQSRDWRNSIGLDLTWNVWDGGRRSADEHLEKLALSKAEQDAIVRANDVLHKTAEAYLGLARALTYKRLHEEKLQLLQRQKLTIEERVKNGLAAETGLMEIESRIQQSEAAGVVLKRKLKTAQTDLINTMGTDTINGVKVADIFELKVTPLKPPPKISWEQSPLAKVLALDEQDDRLKLDKLSAQHGPQIDFTTNLNAGFRDLGMDENLKSQNHFSTSSVNLSVKYNLFDAGRQRHEKAALVSSQTAKRFEREQKRSEQERSYEDLHQEMALFAAQLTASRKLLEMEKKRFNIVEREYRRGAQSYLDLVTALDALSIAQQAVDDDLIAEQLGLIRLHNMAGSIYGAIMD